MAACGVDRAQAKGKGLGQTRGLRTDWRAQSRSQGVTQGPVHKKCQGGQFWLGTVVQMNLGGVWIWEVPGFGTCLDLGRCLDWGGA
eukprot:354345-Chlamydomonas_euryale.AAC.3